jgi:hypothetical protein
MGARSGEEPGMTKFLLLTSYAGGAGSSEPMTDWDAEDIKAHLDFLRALNQELSERGELIDAQALTGPELAKIVTSDGAGPPVITDGPFPEVKELLAGYQMVDVESQQRARPGAAGRKPRPGRTSRTRWPPGRTTR